MARSSHRPPHGPGRAVGGRAPPPYRGDLASVPAHHRWPGRRASGGRVRRRSTAGMSPEEGELRPVIGSDGAAAPVAGGLAVPGETIGSHWAWDGEALPVPVPTDRAVPLD